VGNKTDTRKREVDAKDAISLAREFKMDYIEASARTGENVEIMFRRIILHVASMLPAVKGHLELTNLPDGWIAAPANQVSDVADRTLSLEPSLNGKYNVSEVPAQISASLPTTKMHHPQHRKSITSTTTMKKSVDSNNGNDSPSNSTGGSNRGFNSNTEALEALTTYINYWTGEEVREKPSNPAPIPLLFDTLTEEKRIELESRYYCFIHCSVYC
jgi:hypothetical protein